MRSRCARSSARRRRWPRAISRTRSSRSKARAARSGPIKIETDEHPRSDTTAEGLAKLKTPFRNPGTVTAGNASRASFTTDEATRGTSGLVAVISHHLWQTTFQAMDGIVGHAITLNGRPATVVGVAEPDFHGAIMSELADLWLPLAGALPEHLDQGRGTAVAMIGRLAPGRSAGEAQAELSTLWSQLQVAEPALSVFGMVPQKYKVRLVPYSATAGGNSLVSMFGYRMLAIFSVVTLLTILIVCANVANLLIARAVVRQREIALRQSLGASRFRVVRSLIAEGLALSAVAWIAACLFAWWVSRAIATYLIPALAPGPVVFPALTPDWTVIGYALVLAVLCTLAVTVGPALRTWSQPLLPFLKAGEQALVASRSKLSGGLVVLQLAFSVLLLTSAGLAHRSFTVANGTDVGFDTHNILMATVNTAGSASSPDANLALIETLRTRLARMPQVESVSYVPGTRVWPWVNFPVRRDRSSDPVLSGRSADFTRLLQDAWCAAGCRQRLPARRRSERRACHRHPPSRVNAMAR